MFETCGVPTEKYQTLMLWRSKSHLKDLPPKKEEHMKLKVWDEEQTLSKFIKQQVNMHIIGSDMSIFLYESS